MERVNVDPLSGNVDIDGVAIPFRVTADFLTSWFKPALDYWEHYEKYAQRMGKTPYSSVEYLDALCLVLGSREIRGRDAQRWKERVVEQFRGVYMERFLVQRLTTSQNDIFPTPQEPRA